MSLDALLTTCPLQPLGLLIDYPRGKVGSDFCAKFKYAFFHATGEVRTATHRELQSAGKLLALFDGDTVWLRKHFRSPGGLGFNAKEAVEYLTQQCDNFGRLPGSVVQSVAVLRADQVVLVRWGTPLLRVLVANPSGLTSPPDMTE